MTANGDLSAREILERLVDAPEILLAHCKICDPYDLMNQLTQAFDLKDISPDHLLRIMQSGEEAIEPDLADFFRYWRPTGYSIKNGAINWRLILGELPFAPFYDEQIANAVNRSLLATLLNPRISLKYILSFISQYSNEIQGRYQSDSMTPAGFIFHCSRCGSTLVSNSMAATQLFTVISEASVLTDLLLDTQLSDQHKIAALKWLIPMLGDRLIVKLNAWDISFLPLIHQAFPDAKILFLTRRPEEVLRSHQRSVGIHMVPGHQIAEVFGHSISVSLLDYQAEVMMWIYARMLEQYKVLPASSAAMVDYRDLDLDNMCHIAVFFGGHMNQLKKSAVSAIMQRYSKSTDDLYKDRRAVPESTDRFVISERIQSQLTTLYRALRSESRLMEDCEN
ncbi:hypothetical protein [Bowmanella denitrificans]|uniref:hypothetical protein n=1 Tax=Bowmanella denitrificans TaxID=366582 RepID=UPI000C999203|nr:hypothetical protein [Bowmanella denitrificans]